MNQERQDELQRNLLAWFSKHQREMPWRNTKDPYHIWVSEIMLQQTRVDTVTPYYERFMGKFSTVGILAGSDLEDVLKMWEGLGYYARARNLWKGANVVVDQYNGEIPSNEKQLKKIPGIGDYTSGAILSIAYNLPVPAVDGNVMRVLSRVCALEIDIASSSAKSIFPQIAEKMIPPGQASDFNQALMELGALICTPTGAKCLLCPLYSQCEARSRGIQEELPVKSPRKKTREVRRGIAIVRSGSQYLIRKRKEEGLLGGLWEFPGYDIAEDEDEQSLVQVNMEKELMTRLSKPREVVRAQHVFTHMKWVMTAYFWQVDKKIQMPEEWVWASADELKKLPFPGALKKILKWVYEQE